jgi:hypothetical protein
MSRMCARCCCRASQAAGSLLRRLDSDIEGTGRAAATALMTALHRVDADVEKIVGRPSLEPTVAAARWQAEVHFDSEGRQSLAPDAGSVGNGS